jgi:hypothetical protein
MTVFLFLSVFVLATISAAGVIFDVGNLVVDPQEQQYDKRYY